MDDLEEGRAAAQRYDWKRSYECLGRAVASGVAEPATLAELGDVCMWLQLHEEGARLRERAYRAYFASGDRANAASIALKLVGDYTALAQPTVSAGWRRRAEELLADAPLSAIHAKLALTEANALQSTDLDGALAAAERALRIARDFADHDTEILATCRKGAIVVGLGRVQEGLRLQDAALTAAVGGEIGPHATILVYCWLISTCEVLGDVNRAAEWSDVALRYCGEASIVGFPGVCRLHRTRILALKGAWAEAETEARSAHDAIRPSGPSMAGAALAEVAELRRRRGDIAGAWELAEQAMALGAKGSISEAIFARIVADREGPAAGLYRAERALRARSGDPYYRAQLIPVYVDLAIAAGRPEPAEVWVADLDTSAERANTAVLRGYASSARGRLRLARGDAEGARAALEQAVAAWEEADVPYEGARDRAELARAILARGDCAGALIEAREALAVLEALGAEPEAQRTRALIVSAEGFTPISRSAVGLMFVDMVSSTALIEAIGDGAWRDLSAWTDAALRRAFVEHQGREVDHPGDGFFVAFATADRALACAETAQRFLQEHRRSHGYAPQVRIGVHWGDVDSDGQALRGAAVHRAARICGAAQAGEILASREALEAARRRAALRPLRVKGIQEEIEVGAVTWSSGALATSDRPAT